MGPGTTSTDTVGELVRRFRLDRGLTLEGLAEAAGLSERAIGDIERGASERPQRRTLVALASALRLDRAEQDALRTALATPSATRERDGITVEPVPAVDFQGRWPDLAALEAVLRPAPRQGPPIVLAGPPGVGKTTLMVEAADRFVERGRPRAFVDLRGLDAVPVPPIAVIRAVLQQIEPERDPPRALGAAETEWRAVAEAQRPVVLLDNASSEDQVRPVLAAARHAAIVITSRSRLPGLEGVRRRPLEPLSAADSVALLGAIAPGVDGDAELARVAALCDHMPLALRVAGNRLASRPEWSVGDLVAGLESEERRLGALQAGDLAIGSAFDLSYRHMDAATRRLFRLLAILPATSFSAEIAAQLLGPGMVEVAEAGMDALVDLGMVQPVAGRRFRLHDLVRLFAAARMREEEPPGERAAAARRLEDWLLDVARAAGSHFEPGLLPTPVRDVDLPDRAAADRWLRQESEHWYRAVRGAAAGGQHRRVVEVALRLHWFSDRWLRWGRWLELFALAATSAAEVGPAEHADLLGHVAWAQIVEREAFAEAAETARRAERLADESGAALPLAWATFYRAWAETRLERFDDSVASAQVAFDRFASARDPEGAAQALMLAVFALRRAGRDAEVQASADAVIAYLDRESLDDYVAGCTRANAAMYSAQAAMALGDPEGALAWSDRGTAYADAVGLLRVAAETASIHAAAQTALGRRDAALAELDGVLRRFEATGERERAEDTRRLRERLLADA